MAKFVNLCPHDRFAFDPKAHEILGDAVVSAEDRLVQNGVCKPSETDAILSAKLIAQCGSMIRGSSLFVESDVYNGCGIFLDRIALDCNRTLSTKLKRNDRICSMQLQWHTQLYLRNFEALLYQTYLELLPSLPNVSAIDQNGIMKLAAAMLPNGRSVRRDINRERQRRGAEGDRIIVPNDALELRNIANTRRTLK